MSSERAKGIIRKVIDRPDGAEEILSLLGDDLFEPDGRTYLVLPSGRMSREIAGSVKRGFIDRITHPARLPDVLYDRSGIDLPVVDERFRNNAVQGIMEGMSLKALRPEGGDMSIMAPHVANAIVGSLRNGVDPDDLRTVARTERSKELFRIYEGYVGLLSRSRALDREMLPRLLAQRLREGMLKGIVTGVYLIGRVDRSYRDLLDAMIDAGERAYVFEHRVRTEGWTLSRPGTRDRIVRDSPIEVIRGEDRLTALRNACRVIKRAILVEGVEPSEVSLVTPGGSLHERMVPSVMEEYGIPYEIEKELEVSEVPAVAGFLKLLGLPGGDWRSSDLSAGLSLMGGRFDPLGDSGVSGSELDVLFRTHQVFGGSEADDWTGPLLGDEKGSGYAPALGWLLGRISALSDVRADQRVLSRDLRSFLGDLRTAIVAGSIDDTREDALDLLDRTIGRVPSEDPDPGRATDLGDFLKRLRSSLTNVKLPLGTVKGGVWVGKMKQQTGRRCGLMVLLSPVSGEYPRRRSEFSLLTEVERSSLGMRDDPDRREELEDLGVCLTTGDRTVISLPETADDRPTEVSPFLEGVPLEGTDAGKGILSRTEAMVSCAVAAGPRLQAEEVLGGLENGHALAERSRARRAETGPMEDPEVMSHLGRRFGPERVWSVTQLETYRRCPYEFFARYVLGIREQRTLEPEVPPDMKGTLIHAILEGFYSRWKARGKGGIDRDDLDEAWSVMMASAREVLSGYSYRGPFWEAMVDLLLGPEGEKGILREFIEMESDYAGPYLVDSLERRFGPLSITGGEDRILLEGIVDRVDVHDGMFTVWDYKTGNPRRVDRGSVQVPLYMAALSGELEPAGGGYILVGNRGMVGRQPVVDEDVQKAREKIERTIDLSCEIVNKVRSGSFPAEGKCADWCPYRDMCRRDA